VISTEDTESDIDLASQRTEYTESDIDLASQRTEYTESDIDFARSISLAMGPYNGTTY
jgi:hypothetical protein